MLTEKEINLMYEVAVNARNDSYSPYSNFKVGACVLLNNGETFGGSNVENASYGLTSCAERNTLFQVYNYGFRKGDIKALLIVGDTKGPITPCGACRQVMSELMNPDCEVVMTNLEQNTKVVTVGELIPYAFTDEDL